MTLCGTLGARICDVCDPQHVDGQHTAAHRAALRAGCRAHASMCDAGIVEVLSTKIEEAVTNFPKRVCTVMEADSPPAAHRRNQANRKAKHVMKADSSGSIIGRIFLATLVSATWLLAPGLAGAQDFSLDWFTMAAGGESSGGDLELSATVGQPDAGDLLGGDFAITGGFWSIVTVMGTPVAILLTVSLANGNVIISWSESDSTGFALEETAALANPSGNTAWTTVNAMPQASNGTKSVHLPLASGNRFYRLRKP